MKFLVINANENDGHKIVNIVNSSALNQFCTNRLIGEKFPWVSFVIVDKETFLSEYFPYKEEYFSIALSR